MVVHKGQGLSIRGDGCPWLVGVVYGGGTCP